MKNKLRDAIYGFAVADALGVPYEFKARGSFKCVDMVGYGTWCQPKGTFSDDTSMTLATCKSIKDNGRIVLEDIMNNFKKWCFYNEFTANGKRFDIGRTTYHAISNGKGLDDVNSNGNGSLMRILPLAFIYCNLKDIKEVSSLTHANDISIMACQIYVYIAKQLIKGKNIKEAIGQFKSFFRLNDIEKLSENEIKSTGYVIDTLEASLWCLATTDNYKDCILKAVNLGGDTDTIAAVAGGLAGIIYSYDSIPKEWIEALTNKELIENCLF